MSKTIWVVEKMNADGEFEACIGGLVWKKKSHAMASARRVRALEKQDGWNTKTRAVRYVQSEPQYLKGESKEKGV